MGEHRSWLPPFVAGLTVTVVFLAVLSIILTAAGPAGLGLTERQTSTWIFAGYALPMIPSVVLTLRHRIPMLLTGNIFALIFFASLGSDFTLAALAGAAIVAGAILLATTIVGVTKQVVRWISLPVVYGLIGGAVLPFVVDLFSSLSPSAVGDDVAIVVGSALVAYLLGLRFLPSLPPVLPAFVVGTIAAAVTGALGPLPSDVSLPDLELVSPTFSWRAVLTVTPVLVALLTVQANVPSVVYLRSQGYEPSPRTLDVVSGAGTVVSSFLGPVAMSLSFLTSLVLAGPSAGAHDRRYRSTYLPLAAGIAIALLANLAADLAVLFPPAFLLAIAGLALLPALTSALREDQRGPARARTPVRVRDRAVGHGALRARPVLLVARAGDAGVGALRARGVAAARAGAGVRVGVTRSTVSWVQPTIPVARRSGGSGDEAHRRGLLDERGERLLVEVRELLEPHAGLADAGLREPVDVPLRDVAVLVGGEAVQRDVRGVAGDRELAGLALAAARVAVVERPVAEHAAHDDRLEVRRVRADQRIERRDVGPPCVVHRGDVLGRRRHVQLSLHLHGLLRP